MKFYIELPKDLEIKTAIVRRLEPFCKNTKTNPISNDTIMRMISISCVDEQFEWSEADWFAQHGHKKVTIDEALAMLEKKEDEKIMWGVHEVVIESDGFVSIGSYLTTAEDWSALANIVLQYNIDEIHCHDCSDRKIVVKRGVLDRIVEKCNA